MLDANLLTDPLLRVQITAGLRLLSLPGVLAALAQDQVAQFPGLQAHQEHAWHAFLVQVAAMALHRANEEAPLRRAGYEVHSAGWSDELGGPAHYFRLEAT